MGIKYKVIDMKLICTFFCIITIFVSAGVITASPQGAADELFSYIDLDAPELSGVKSYYQSGQYTEALDAYRDIFLDNIYQLSFSDLPSYSSNADDILNSNIVRMNNLEGGYESHDIGAPGSVDWFFATSFEHWTYYLSNMHWTSSLIDKYAQSPSVNTAYLEKWLDLWRDFSLNNYDQWNAIRGTAEEDDYGGLFTNIWLHRLILGDRVKYLFSQLSTASKADLATTKSIIEGEKLAWILSEMAERNMPRLNSTIHGGVPNQVISSALGLAQSGFGFIYFNDAATWKATGEFEIQDYLTTYYMADGTDMEQSFNYNGSMINIGMDFQDLYQSSGDPMPGWVSDYAQAMLYRFRMLGAIVRPNGMLPGLDLQSDTDAYSRLSGYQAYFNDTLAGQIIDHTWMLSPSEPAPFFDSIYFPFGGYAVIRDGWDNNANHLFMKVSRMGKGHMDQSSNQVQITAFGKTMLVDSGGSLYVSDYRNQYFRDSFAHNTIIVDGKSQYMGGEHWPAYTTPLSNRYLTGGEFDFVEGSFGSGINGGYGDGAMEITDVTHKREVSFLRNAGVYVIVDRIESAGSHSYTQIWNFDKGFAKDEVSLAAVDKILTVKEFQPNVAIYNFSEHAPLSYTRYHGYYDGINVFGWAKNSLGNGYTAAVDTHRSWTGTGEQLLVTLVAPMNWDNEPVTVNSSTATSDLTGFEAVSTSGETIKYTARKTAGSITIDDISVSAESLLVTDDGSVVRGVALGCSSFDYMGNPQSIVSTDFEFIIENGIFSVVSDVTVPSIFNWIEDGTQTRPAYFDTVDIEIQVQPPDVTTVNPSAGVYNMAVNTEYVLQAEDYINCPAVDRFSHWLVDGVFYSDEPELSMTATASISVTAVFTDDRQCGDICHPVPRSDINGDCRVGVIDLSMLAEAWLTD